MRLLLQLGKPAPRHERYDAQRQARAFWRWSDRARHDYATGSDASGSRILPPHEREPQGQDSRYNRRLKQAIVRPYVRSIVDRYNDHVCRRDATRPEATGIYGEIVHDATGGGMSLPKLTRRALRKAQVEGCSYLLADSSVSGIFDTAAAAAAAGKRPVMRLIGADQVLWWRDWQGEVVEALLLFADRDGVPFLWHVSDTMQQRINIGTDKGDDLLTQKIIAIGPEQPHHYGGCPLVRLQPDLGGEDDDCAGEESQAGAIAESQKRICNLDSLLLEEIQSITFTTTVLLGVSPDQVKDVAVGPGMALCLPGGNGVTPGVGKISSDTAQAESIRKSLAYELGELYRSAGLAPGNPTEVGQPESGVSKAFAFNEVEARLASLADAAEHAENLAVKRLAADAGFAYPGDSDWPDEFAPDDLAENLEYTIRVLTSPLPQVLKDAQTRRFAEGAFELAPDQQAQLTEQLDNPEPPPASNPLAALNAGRMAGT